MADKPELSLQIVIKRQGQLLLDSEKITVLREIQKGGSLRIAAQQLHLSYQHAWTIIDEMNRRAPLPIVSKQRGGVGGGGAVLTSYGKKILEDYRLIEAEVQKFTNRMNTEMNL